MPRDGGFLREVAARDKLGSQQAGDLYLPVLGAGRHLRRFRVRHSREPKFSTEGKDICELAVGTGVLKFKL